MVVVDASVAVKWFIQQQGSEAAEAVLTQFLGQISVPDLFGIEVAATLVREANINKANAQYSRNGVDRLCQYLSEGFVTSYGLSPGQLVRSTNVAIDLGHPLKDCIYLVLAMELGTPLITCDIKFVIKALEIYKDVTAV